MKNRNLGDSFKNAVSGIFYVIRAERNMKLHVLAALVVIFLSISYKLDRLESISICIVVGLVILCELFNTAIEVLVDLVVETYHPKAKIVKDAAAGGVLISAIISVIVGYIIFIDKVSRDAENIIGKLKGLDIKITIAALVLIIVLFAVTIAAVKRKTSIGDCIDAGIALFVSSMAAVVLLWNGNIQNSILFSGVAALIVISRVKRQMQNVLELLGGSVAGLLIVLLIYQFIN